MTVAVAAVDVVVVVVWAAARPRKDARAPSAAGRRKRMVNAKDYATVGVK